MLLIFYFIQVLHAVREYISYLRLIILHYLLVCRAFIVVDLHSKFKVAGGGKTVFELKKPIFCVIYADGLA